MGLRLTNIHCDLLIFSHQNNLLPHTVNMAILRGGLLRIFLAPSILFLLSLRTRHFSVNLNYMKVLDFIFYQDGCTNNN